MDAKWIKPHEDRYNWGGQHGHNKIQSSDEGKVHGCGISVDIILKAVSEKYTVRLCMISNTVRRSVC
jgi:hypothetical protein